MTLQEAMLKIAEIPAWSWTATWWRYKCIIVNDGKKTWEAKGPDDPLPREKIQSLGCSGTSHTGRLDWIGWDLDVDPERKHGVKNYPTTTEAIADARKIRTHFDNHCEIRLSKSGKGVHVRLLLPQEHDLTPAKGVEIAKGVAASLKIQADATPLGRQAFWLWARTPPKDAFKLIEPLVI